MSYAKNALSELYNNLSLQVLSDEYEVSLVYDAIKDLTAGISTNIENRIRSNQLKREEDAAKMSFLRNQNTNLYLKNQILKKQKRI